TPVAKKTCYFRWLNNKTSVKAGNVPERQKGCNPLFTSLSGELSLDARAPPQAVRPMYVAKDRHF
ncbi:MAG: hypothetical protein WCO71_11855, partial [Pseudomonadota bacterium]